jgi:NADH-quinone oxidoreductase subunit C
MSEKLQDLAGGIEAAVPGTTTKIAFGELTVNAEAASIVHVLTVLREDFAFKSLIDICGADYPARPKRFDIVYHLLSLTKNARIRVKVQAGDGDTVPTATGVFAGAGWFEREAYDMYGVTFAGHPDMRRLLTDYGFEGHPLRKDFPVTGFVELRYDDDQKRCVYKPVSLVQEFREFDFASPWEGMPRVLPGDEKATAEKK